MKHFIALLLAIACFSSCVQYQIFETSIEPTTWLHEENDAFVFENDTIRIDYYFWENQGVMSFSIFNKLSRPVYVDWKNSSFIYNGNKYNYWTDQIMTTGTSTAYYNRAYNGLWYQGNGITARTFQTTNSSKPERITFIPPKSFFSKSSFILLTTGPVANSDVFTIENSPLVFRNYLAISLSESSTQYQFIDNKFYLATMYWMKSKQFMELKGSPKHFYIKIAADE